MMETLYFFRVYFVHFILTIYKKFVLLQHSCKNSLYLKTFAQN